MSSLTAFIETVPLLSGPSGLANYVAGLLRGFGEIPDAPRCLSGLASWRSESLRRLEDACRALVPDMPFLRIPCPNRIATALPGPASLAARPRCPAVDIAHATANSFSSWLPPTARARVLTIHDVVFLRHRNGTLCSPDLGRRLAARLPRDCRAAAVILTDSEFSKAEICDLLGVPPAKVAVAYLASSLCPVPEPHGPAVNPQAQPAVLSGSPFLLYVGTIEPRKNIATLLDAFSRFREDRPEARLTMVGKPAWRGAELVARAQRTPGVDYRDRCGAQALVQLYRQARGTLLVSRYEGFGLPVLEAMCLGCPVCYGTGSSMGEVAGDAGIAVCPDDRDGIVEAMRVLWEDESQRQSLIRRGTVRATRFTWAHTAAATVAAYRAALEQAS